jgi:hypothetical protein
MARLVAAPRLQRTTRSTSATRTITLCTLFVACLDLVLLMAKLTLHDGQPAGFVEVGAPFADGTPLRVGALLALLAEPRRTAPLPLVASVLLWVWMVQIAASV